MIHPMNLIEMARNYKEVATQWGTTRKISTTALVLNTDVDCHLIGTKVRLIANSAGGEPGDIDTVRSKFNSDYLIVADEKDIFKDSMYDTGKTYTVCLRWLDLL